MSLTLPARPRTTEQQTVLLHRAIDAAQGLGRRRYVVREARSTYAECVIAHLFIMNGGTLHDIFTWDITDIYGLIKRDNKEAVQILGAYPLDLLYLLQKMWDLDYLSLALSLDGVPDEMYDVDKILADEEREAKIRQIMHELVDRWNSASETV